MEALKILVVDDESRMRKLVKDFLAKKNFQVLEASDGEEAMDIFYQEKDIALIILDVMMPKMDGWEAVSYTHLDVYKRQDGHNSECLRPVRGQLQYAHGASGLL